MVATVKGDITVQEDESLFIYQSTEQIRIAGSNLQDVTEASKVASGDGVGASFEQDGVGSARILRAFYVAQRRMNRFVGYFSPSGYHWTKVTREKSRTAVFLSWQHVWKPAGAVQCCGYVNAPCRTIFYR